jgi:hypothetical protein
MEHLQQVLALVGEANRKLDKVEELTSAELERVAADLSTAGYSLLGTSGFVLKLVEMVERRDRAPFPNGREELRHA